MTPTPEEIAAQKAIDDKAAADKVVADKVAADKLAADKAAADAAKKTDPLEAFNEYLATLDPAVRVEIEKHTGGLKTALVSERGLNKDSKTALARLKELEDAEEVRKKASMTELQKAQADKEKAEKSALQLQEDLKTERIKNAILAAATDFADPNDAYTMIDHSLLEIDDKTGKVTGVAAAIEALVKAKPYLLKTADQEFNINGGEKGKSGKLPKNVRPKIRF